MVQSNGAVNLLFPAALALSRNPTVATCGPFRTASQFSLLTHFRNLAPGSTPISQDATLVSMVIVVMGVSGSGKSTIGSGIAAKLGWPFRDGDDFHPAANRAKMSQGIPLTDEDRWPWLDAIAQFARETASRGENAVVACSALKDAYRSRLQKGCPKLRFVYLHGSQELLEERMKARKGHFMPASLMASQFATLEPLQPDERGVTIDVAEDVDRIVANCLAYAGVRERR